MSSQPMFTVVKGNPTAEEEAALAAALTQFRTFKERNQWGKQQQFFNPNAYRTVTYF